MIDQTISHYRILEELGRGGMGVIYKARDTRLDRAVALKFLPPDLTRNPDAKARFIREAKAASALKHQNICTIHDIDETEDGQLFIVMDCYEGETLQEKIARGPLAIEEALHYAAQTAEALMAAHAEDIIHRDIKPGNIFIMNDGTVKLLDFGLAKFTDKTQLTREATTLGTLSYMSPEQVRGDSVDHRTDIWSFGIVLYEMLAGRTPFLNTYDAAVMYAILNHNPPPIEHGLRSISPQLISIITKCLEKDPMDRFQLFQEIVPLLHQEFQQTVPEENHPHQYEGLRSPRKNYIMAALLGAAIMLIVLLIQFVIPWNDHELDNTFSRIAVLPFQNVGPADREYFADGISEELSSRLSTLEALRVVSYYSSRQYKSLEKSLREIGRELDVPYVVTGSILWENLPSRAPRIRIIPRLIRIADETELWSRQFDAELTEVLALQSTMAETITHQIGMELHPQEKEAFQARATDNADAYMAYLRALALSKQRDFEEALRWLNTAVNNDPRFALAYAIMSEMHSLLYHYGKDRSDHRISLAKEAVDKALSLNPELSEAHFAKGLVSYRIYRDYESALEEYQIASRLQPGRPDIMSATGWIYKRQGKYHDALALYQEALSLDPRNESITSEIGEVLRFLRRYAEAEYYYNLSIQINPVQEIVYGTQIENLWAWKGNTQEVRELVSQSLRGKRVPYTLTQEHYMRLFRQEVYDRRYQAAFVLIDSIPGDALTVMNFYYPKSLLKALVYHMQGKSADALYEFENSRILLEQTLRTHTSGERLQFSLCIVYAGLGMRTPAIQMWAQAFNSPYIQHDILLQNKYKADVLATIYLLLEEYDSALNVIEELLSKPSQLSTKILEMDPQWAPARNLPKYNQLIQQYGIVEAQKQENTRSIK